MRLFQKRLGESDEGNHETNLTPLIDVSLVLVVILLLATPLALESSILLRSSDSTGKQAEKDTKIERVELELVSEDIVEVNGRPVPRSELKQALTPMLSHEESNRVLIICGAGVSHGAFVNVLDQAKVCGASEIAVMGS